MVVDASESGITSNRVADVSCGSVRVGSPTTKGEISSKNIT